MSKWLIALSSAYEYSDDLVFFDSATHAADYLLQDEHRPHGDTFHDRYSERKDSCNQLVGQVLTIRALTYAGDVLDRPEVKSTAAEIF